MAQNGVPCFRSMLLKVSQALTIDETQQLAFLCEVPGEKPGSALDVFSALEKGGKLSERNYTILLKCLKDISRMDLHKMCEEMMQGNTAC